MSAETEFGSIVSSLPCQVHWGDCDPAGIIFYPTYFRCCEVRSRIARFGGKSFVVAHDIVRNDGVTLAKAQETRVWGRYVSGPGTPLRGETIPQDVKQRFRAR